MARGPFVEGTRRPGTTRAAGIVGRPWIAEDQRLVKKVALTVNGRPVQVVADEKQAVLLDLVREDLGLTGAKQSCDRKGQCGTCMVLVDGKAVLSCVTKVAALDGADVTTIEGLGTPDRPHLIQQAFVLAGAVQCGFCIPGMVLTAKELLDANPDPTRAEVKRALRRNLCRCTGYVKIIDAVQLAGRFLRGEITPGDLLPGPDAPPLGVSHPRPSAMAKACGTAAFGADIRMPGALEIAVVRSPHAHALIRGIDTTAAAAMPGVAGVMTAADIKGTNRIKYTVADRPVLCDDKVRTLGDAVAIVAAETKEQALAAVDAVVVDYEPLPVLASPADALAEGAPQVHPDLPNLCYSQPIVKGDAAAAFASAAAVVEGRFRTQINHQAPLEPEVSLAYMDGEGEDAELVIIGRSINIHLAMASLQAALGWEAIRYEEAFSGGQFGIKVEVITEGIAAAAALHFRRPVRYVPSLAESMLITSKRHPFDMGIRLAADADGRLTALGMDITVDNGAYMSLGIVILNRALHMLTSSYFVPNIDVTSRLVYTNNPWGSAARGAGPPQTHYAVECAIDLLAEKMGIDPLEFRRRNSLLPGQTKATGAVVKEWPFPGLCDALRPRYEEARREAATYAAAHDGNGIRRGVGLGAAAFGIAMPGDKSIAAVELDPDDGATVYVAAADPGEGNDSMLSQLVASVLDLPLAKVRLADPQHGRHHRVRPGIGEPRHLHDRRGRRGRGPAAPGGHGRGGRPHARRLRRLRPSDPLRRPADDPGDGAARPGDRPGPLVRGPGLLRPDGRGRGRHRDRRGEGDPAHVGRRPGPGHPPAERRGPAGRRDGHGRRLRPAGGVRRREDEGLGHLQVPQHPLRHGPAVDRRRDAARARDPGVGRHRRDGHGLHGAGHRERHPRRLRRDGLRAAGDAGPREGGPGGGGG